jgi:hypothetical protein
MRTRSIALLLGVSTLAVSAPYALAAEGAAGGIRWNTPSGWTVGEPRPMRKATYTIPAAPGAEAGECGVFFFGKGQGGTVDENLSRWVAQFETTGAPKKSQTTVHGLPVHRIDVSGTYLAPGGPMMQSQGKKPNWRLSGAIVEAPEGLVFFKAVGPAVTMQAAQKDIDELIKSITKAEKI